MKIEDGRKLHAIGRDSIPEAYEAPPFNGHLQLISNFSIWHLSVKEAADLAVMDMWFSGAIPEIEEPEDWDGNEHDPGLKALLAGHTEAMEARLVAAVNCGRMETDKVQRDFEETLITGETYISFQDLSDWLLERGYEYGDHMDGWIADESEIASQVCNEIAYLRAARMSGKGVIRSIALQGMFAKVGKLEDKDIQGLTAGYKLVMIENQKLKDQLSEARAAQPSKVDRPVTTRQRRTLLTIIASLCRSAGIDPQARGAAQRIKGLVEILGVSMDDDTVAKVLKEIPDAIESRMK
jgi:hypothetical protein